MLNICHHYRLCDHGGHRWCHCHCHPHRQAHNHHQSWRILRGWKSCRSLRICSQGDHFCYKNCVAKKKTWYLIIFASSLTSFHYHRKKKLFRCWWSMCRSVCQTWRAWFTRRRTAALWRTAPSLISTSAGDHWKLCWVIMVLIRLILCRDCTWPPPEIGEKPNCWAKKNFTRSPLLIHRALSMKFCNTDVSLDN